MRKIYHLSTCNTCKKIIKALNDGAGFELQDIKTVAITEAQLSEMYALAGSYEALFSRRSRKYRPMGLHEKTLTEADYKVLIFGDYSFLKRPVVIIDGHIFIGNAQKTITAAQAMLT